MSRLAGRRPHRRLWHFTCDHGHNGIGARGELRPYQHPMIPHLPPMVWLTSAARPARTDVGLTSTMLSCDRLAHRYEVTDITTAEPWSVVRQRVPAQIVATLEQHGRPGTWFVSFAPVPVVLA